MMTEPTNRWIYFFKRITCLSSWIQYHLWQVIKCLFTLLRFDLLDTTAVFERLGQEHVIIFLL